MTYADSLEKVRAASKAFRAVTEKYRTREIGDAEFLAAHAVMKAADLEFDAAFAEKAPRG